MSLYWEFPWVQWESHGNGNSYSSFIGMGWERESGDGNGGNENSRFRIPDDLMVGGIC